MLETAKSESVITKIVIGGTHGNCFSAADQAGSWRSRCWDSMVSHVVMFDEALSSVIV